MGVAPEVAIQVKERHQKAKGAARQKAAPAYASSVTLDFVEELRHPDMGIRFPAG